MTKTIHTDVLVVGGGPAGVALSYLLARNGYGVVLAERHEDFERAFRGEGLMPGGKDVIRQMGLMEAFRSVPQTQVRSMDFWLEGKRVVSIAPDSIPDTLPIMISQPHFLQMMADEAAKFPGFQLWMKANLHGLIEEEGRFVGAHLKVDGEEREIRARLVVGADGRTSATLKLAQLPSKIARKEDFDVFWGRFPWPPSMADGDAFGVVADRALTLGFQNPFGDLQIAALIDKGGFGDLRAHGLDQWIEELADRVPPVVGPFLRDNRDKLAGFTVLNVQVNRADEWWRPGVLVIGDAAHTMSPVGAQGGNVALRDAVVAANHLVPALRVSDAAVDIACARTQEERMKEIVPCQALQARPPRLLRSKGLMMRTLRAVAPWLVQLPILQNAITGQADKFIHGITEVHLEV